jgi:hypothetical protein
MVVLLLIKNTENMPVSQTAGIHPAPETRFCTQKPGFFEKPGFLIPRAKSKI